MWCVAVCVAFLTHFGVPAPITADLGWRGAIALLAGLLIVVTSYRRLRRVAAITLDGETLRIDDAGRRSSRDLRSFGVVFVERHLTVSRDSEGRPVGSISYALCADVDGKGIVLLGDLAKPDEARYFEATIRSHLAAMRGTPP